MERIKYFFSVLFSYLIAIIRLLFWVFILFSNGLQKILFCRVEICSVEVRGLPLRCDREDMYNKLSYVDKLRVENPELADMPYCDEDEPQEEFNEDDFNEDEGEE